MAREFCEKFENKEHIRKDMIRRLREQEPSLREEKSIEIQKKLLSDEDFRKSRTVMGYVSLPTEVSTDLLINEALEQGKRVAVPYTDQDTNNIIAVEITSMNDLEEGAFKIRQPRNGLKKRIKSEEIDLIIVPAIAYDKKNMRLGRGKGYYDRFLSQKQFSCVKKIGLAFDFQVIDNVPSAPHDEPVTTVITN